MSDTKLCPYCGEEIKAIAIKCKICGSMLTPTGTDQPVSSITLVKQALASKYEIIEEIGKGGMATVYRALQKNLHREVALKVIHQNLIHDSEFIARFHREAQVCANLSHTNIVTVYDEGEINGVHFMAMELLSGTDLHRLIHQKGRLEAEEAIRYIAPIAQALDHAHQKGLIHRDVKSSNIIITRDGRSVLTDFGIAHAAEGTKLTQTGTIIGTPEYMSPEQAEGKPLDHRSDIYSLGIVLYECLSGKVPFKGDNPLITIHKIIYDQPEPLSRISGIPQWIEQIVTQCLEKDVTKRIQSGVLLSNSLTPREIGIQNDDTIPLGTKKTPSEPVQQKVPPKKQGSVGLKVFIWLLVLTLLTLGGVWGYNYFRQLEKERNERLEAQRQERQQQEWQIEQQKKLEEQKRIADSIAKAKEEANRPDHKTRAMSTRTVGQEVQFSAHAKTVVTVGETFTLNYTLNAQGSNFRGPNIQGIDILSGPNTSTSTSYSIVNGSTTRSITYIYTYTYLLQASREGTVYIPVASVMVNGKQFTSNVLSFKVVKNPNATRITKPGQPEQIEKVKEILEARKQEREQKYIERASRDKSSATGKQQTQQGTFTDNRDGKNYKWVRIGNQTWMSENLAYRASNGCWAYDNDQSNVASYGCLYNWETACKVCPSGWHLPSNEEWSLLVNSLGGEEVAGGKMKETGNTHWAIPNTEATNVSGFAGLPGGDFNAEGVFEWFSGEGCWWSSTELGSCAWSYHLRNLTGKVLRINIYGKSYGMSIRCIRNEKKAKN